MNDTEIPIFLRKYFNETCDIENKKVWEKEYENPVEMADLIGIYIENNDKYHFNMWVSLDPRAVYKYK